MDLPFLGSKKGLMVAQKWRIAKSIKSECHSGFNKLAEKSITNVEHKWDDVLCDEACFSKIMSARISNTPVTVSYTSNVVF